MIIMNEMPMSVPISILLIIVVRVVSAILNFNLENVKYVLRGTVSGLPERKILQFSDLFGNFNNVDRFIALAAVWNWRYIWRVCF